MILSQSVHRALLEALMSKDTNDIHMYTNLTSHFHSSLFAVDQRLANLQRNALIFYQLFM